MKPGQFKLSQPVKEMNTHPHNLNQRRFNQHYRLALPNRPEAIRAGSRRIKKNTLKFILTLFLIDIVILVVYILAVSIPRRFN